MSIDSAQTPVALPKLAIAAAVLAFLLAAIGLISAFRQVIVIFAALIPLIAGIGILQKRIWSAYGFALFQLMQIAAAPLMLLRASIPKAEIAAASVLNLAVALLFMLAGRSLAATGAKRGLVFPWIAVSCLFTLPFIFLQPFVIPSAAMEDTLLVSDRIMVRVFQCRTGGHYRIPLPNRQEANIRKARDRNRRRSHQDCEPDCLSEQNRPE